MLCLYFVLLLIKYPIMCCSLSVSESLLFFANEAFGICYVMIFETFVLVMLSHFAAYMTDAIQAVTTVTTGTKAATQN